MGIEKGQEKQEKQKITKPPVETGGATKTNCAYEKTLDHIFQHQF